MTRKALGKGLDALIPPAEGPAAAGGGEVTTCRVEEISPSRFQPRQKFKESALRELADSITSQGILQPLLVRPRAKGGFELIAGERRLRAAKLAGLKVAPILVREVDDRGALELSLIENLQREELGPLEEAEGYKKLLTDFGYTQEVLSKRVGKDRATVSNVLRLLKLSDELKADLSEGRISEGHARALLMTESEALRRAIRDAIVAEGLSVREAERRAKGEGKGPKKKGGGKGLSVSTAAGYDVHVKQMQEKLIRELGTRVKIIGSSKGGRIEIQFYSTEDLDRIYRRIIGG